jgi:formylglycine-generating enzyme required for sulfatase activity
MRLQSAQLTKLSCRVLDKPGLVAVKKEMMSSQLELGEPIANSVGMLFVPIPAGQFQMGSEKSDKDTRELERPRHLVQISKTFYLSVYEVTQQQYERVMGSCPWKGKRNVLEGNDFPATYVSWNDAVEFCRRLSEREGVEYRLPTEAELEYACRAGTSTAYSFGDDPSRLEQYAWYRENTVKAGEPYAHSVGRKCPNQFALFDMHGNVAEWCQDWEAPYVSSPVTSDPTGPPIGKWRLLRGGAFLSPPWIVRSAYRFSDQPMSRFNYSGFRPVRTYHSSALLPLDSADSAAPIKQD